MPGGLQAERTAMAWQRTALGLGAVSALLLHHAHGELGPSIPGAAGMAATLALLVMVEFRYLRGRPRDTDDAPMGIGAVRGLTVVTVLLSLASAFVVTGGFR